MPSDQKPDSHEDPDLIEQRHFQHVVDVFMFYRTSATKQMERKMKSLKNILSKHQDMLKSMQKRLMASTAAIDKNFEFIQNVIEPTGGMFENSSMGCPEKEETNQRITVDDMDRVRTTIRQCVRDWGEEGKVERQQSYSPILDELERLFPLDALASKGSNISSSRENISVLVPGAGLGRLMYEIANQGFKCEGNEFSLYMLFTSNYILNMCTEAHCITIHPWLHQTCNVLSNEDQLRPVTIPDVNPRQLCSNAGFSMAAGDFLEVYTEKNKWDCVAMCFFLDTAHNLIEYIETVYSILKPGGYWVNFGPLLYHFADISSETSIEMTYEEVRDIIVNKFKFKLIKEETNMKSGYVANPRSMLSMTYNCVFFVAQKPEN